MISNSDRALLFEYILAKGLPPWAVGKTGQLAVFRKISGLSEQEAIDAYAELEDRGMISSE